MTDDTELQRLTRLRRLAREIAASLQADVDREQAFRVHEVRARAARMAATFERHLIKQDK